MKDYLAIIRKLDFIDLFKYGHFEISYAVPFDGIVTNHTDDDELFNALTYRMNMYEYSFEYIIIHFKSESKKNTAIPIDIRQLCGVYTFDEEAKREMAITFDPRIQLKVSPWSEKFKAIEQKQTVKQCIRGVGNLWAIFGLPKEDRKKCEEIITTGIIQEVVREMYANEKPEGDLSIWVYLLRYERHSFYPKDMVGFFCDFIHVFCNYLKKRVLDGEVAETTEIYHELIKLKGENFDTLYRTVSNTSLKDQTQQVANCNFAIVAPLFLFLRDKFSDGMEHIPEEGFISYAKKVGGFECSVAVYLLGLVLGYDKTYDAFYEAADLRIFDPQKRRMPVCWMKKGKDIIPAFDEKQYSEYENLGYTKVKKYTEKVNETIESMGYNPTEEETRLKKKGKTNKVNNQLSII